MKWQGKVWDGALGTELYERCSYEKSMMAKIPFILEIQKEYLQASIDILRTPTFLSHASYLECSLEESYEQVLKLSLITLEHKKKYPHLEIFASLGPGIFAMKAFSKEQIYQEYYFQLKAFFDSGIDSLFLETFQSLNLVKIMLEATDAFDFKNIYLCISPSLKGFLCDGTFDNFIFEVKKNPRIKAIGMNCGHQEESFEPYFPLFSKTNFPFCFFPSAGIPLYQKETWVYPETANSWVEKMIFYLKKYPFLKHVGGCCGVSPSYISLLSQRIKE